LTRSIEGRNADSIYESEIERQKRKQRRSQSKNLKTMQAEPTSYPQGPIPINSILDKHNKYVDRRNVIRDNRGDNQWLFDEKNRTLNPDAVSELPYTNLN
jgi:hypothetical protein